MDQTTHLHLAYELLLPAPEHLHLTLHNAADLTFHLCQGHTISPVLCQGHTISPQLFYLNNTYS